jgi:hypothetical protein
LDRSRDFNSTLPVILNGALFRTIKQTSPMYPFPAGGFNSRWFKDMGTVSSHPIIGIMKKLRAKKYNIFLMVAVYSRLWCILLYDLDRLGS